MNRNNDLEKIQQAAETLAHLAHSLKSDILASESINGKISSAELVERADELYRTRRKRVRFFDEGLFGEPAWDILLDLFVNMEYGKAVSVSSACLGSGVPTTTALRWVQALQRQDLICRIADERDARRVHLTLSEKGYSLMVEYLNDINKLKK